ncbi:MAG: hypothetical protein ACRC14_13125 [Paracoccaceae bacterium]
MEDILNIPQGRKRIRVGRLCLLLGLTALLFWMIAWRFGEVAMAIETASAVWGRVRDFTHL